VLAVRHAIALQRVTGQQRSHLVVVDLWPFFEEVSYGIKRLGHGEADEVVDLRREPRRGVGRGHGHGEHDFPRTAPAHRLDTGLGRVSGGDPVVGQDDDPVLDGWDRLRADLREPRAQLLALPLGRLTQFLVVDTEVTRQLAIENERCPIIDGTNRQLGISRCAEFSNRTDAERETDCLLYTSPSPRDLSTSRMPSSA